MDIKSESQPFLRGIVSEYSHGALHNEIELCYRCKKTSRIFTLKAGLLHLGILISYTLLFFGYYWQQALKPRLLHDTIRGLDIQVKPTPYVVLGDSPYAGPPSPELDYAWHQLLGNISIRVTADELSRNGNRQESIALPESGGQMAWLGVFHQLHCLQIEQKKKQHMTRYIPVSPVVAPICEDVQQSDWFLDHCLELIRQSIMCTPDVSLTTFTWSSSGVKPMLKIGAYERKCVDWEAFMHGILPRVVSSQEVEGLVNPNLQELTS